MYYLLIRRSIVVYTLQVKWLIRCLTISPAACDVYTVSIEKYRVSGTVERTALYLHHRTHLQKYFCDCQNWWQAEYERRVHYSIDRSTESAAALLPRVPDLLLFDGVTREPLHRVSIIIENSIILKLLSTCRILFTSSHTYGIDCSVQMILSTLSSGSQESEKCSHILDNSTTTFHHGGKIYFSLSIDRALLQ